MFVAIVSRVRAITDLAFRSEVRSERFRKLGGGLDKLKEAEIRYNQLTFTDAENMEQLEFLLNEPTIWI